MINGKIFAVLILAALVLSVAALAQPKADKVFKIPAHAREIAPDVYSLGTATANGKTVEGLMFVYRKDFAQPPWAAKPPSGGTTCYAFLAKGAKWKSLENWLVNPENTRELSGDFVFSNLALDISKWETAAGAGKNILGDGTVTSELLSADTVSPDNKNEVYFADIDSSGAIAVTIVWGIFGGPTFARELVEWDQVYDDVDFDWSSTGEAGKMDFENIATHELGHSVGMGHPSDSCTEETMYRYAAYGETKKRDLNTGDIAGVQALYK